MHHGPGRAASLFAPLSFLLTMGFHCPLRRRILPAVLAMGLLALFHPSASSAAEPIEGDWRWLDAVIRVTATGANSYTGALLQPGVGEGLACVQIGDVVWELHGSGFSYTGTTPWVILGTCAAAGPGDSTWKLSSETEGEYCSTDPTGGRGTVCLPIQKNGNTFDPAKNAGASPVCVSNPINPGVGNKLQTEADYMGTGPFPLVFQRVYNSLPVPSAVLGDGWRHSYERSVLLTAEGSAQVARPDGKVLTFASPTAGASFWVADPDITDRLQSLTDAAGAVTGWRYTASDADQVETYNAQGQLLSIATRAGLTQTLAYDAQGRFASVSDPFGRTLTFSYDAQGRLSGLTDPAGLPISYHYEEATGYLAGVTYQDGTARAYLYEQPLAPHGLTGVVDENGGRYATYDYDAQGRAVLSEHAGGADRTTLVYGQDGTATVTDALGTSRIYGFQTMHGVVKNTLIDQPCSVCGNVAASTAYDANGFAAARTDFNGNLTEHEHDARGLETRRVEAQGAPEERTVTTQWHPTFRLPVLRAEPLRITTYVYHGDDGVTCGATGALCRLAIQPTQDPTGAQGFDAPPEGAPRSWTYTYDGGGQPLAEDGPRTDTGDVTTYSYYPADDPDPGKRGNIATVTNALGHQTQITRYDAHGMPLELVDAHGLTTVLAYDARQRLISRSPGGEETRYAYDAAGQLAQVTLPDGSFLAYNYDAAHRLTGMQDNLGNAVAYTLNAMGNRIQEEVLDPQGVLTRTQRRVYDGLNRLTEEIGAADQTTRFAYDGQGNLASVAGPLERTVLYAYDALNRPVAMTDPAGGVTGYTYDGLDQVVQVTDPRALATRYTLNGLGDLTRLESPDTGVTLHSQDEAGNLAQETDARASIETYTYDALHRVTQITNPQRTFRYDEGAQGIGRLTSMTDPSGGTTWSYDLHGRVIQKTQTVDAVALTVRYGYNALGQRETLTLPSGKVLGFAYDAANRVQSLTVDGAPLLTAIQYRPFGPPEGWTWSNGAPYRRGFDLDGRIASYPLGNEERTLTYDEAGRIAAFTDTQAVENQSFGYDLLDRISLFTSAAGNIGYSYDAVGNRTGETVGADTAAYSYAPASNQLTAVSGAVPATYGYDEAGNTVSANGRTYGYDGRRRLTEVAEGAQSASYRLNGLGQRVVKSTPASGATVFVYDEDGHLLGEYGGDGSPLQEIVWLGETPVAMLRGAEMFYLYADHLGTPRVLADPAGTVRWRWPHADPFGNNPADEDPDADGQPFVFPLRFPGQYFDSETGLHYNYFRDYDPSTGRYIESDPIGLDGGINTYGYVGENPIRYMDFLGLDAELCRRRFYPFILPPYARHCYIRFNKDDNNTLSYDNTGVHPDPAPDWWPNSCEATKGSQNDNCVKREMKKCQADQYNFIGFNCCHCAEKAMKACGIWIPVDNWPNWPVNPGPQPGERGYKP